MSRMQEKASLQNLNDRLAAYTERVRAQEIEINQLQKSVSTVEEEKSTEIVLMRDSYGHEIASLRKALDAVSKDKAKLEIEADKFGKEARESKSKLKDKERAYDSAMKDARSLQNRLDKLQADYDSDKSELKELRPECSKLKQKLEDAKKNLEDETLKRVDLQNQLQSAEEGLKFENQLLEQQLNETKVRKQIEISEIDTKLHDEYDRKMQQSLQVRKFCLPRIYLLTTKASFFCIRSFETRTINSSASIMSKCPACTTTKSSRCSPSWTRPAAAGPAPSTRSRSSPRGSWASSRGTWSWRRPTRPCRSASTISLTKWRPRGKPSDSASPRR